VIFSAEARQRVKSPVTRFVRFESAAPNRRGRHPGVFALANGLAQAGLLSREDRRWLDAANEQAEAAYPDPSTVAPGCYDPAANPGARSWFKAEAVALLGMTDAYLELLDRYGIAWVELRTSHPGRIVYEDDVQVVAVPHAYPADWPFPASHQRIRG